MLGARLGAPDFQGYAGPGDRDLPRSEIDGYQPVSRIGEVLCNAFVDPYEFSALPENLTKSLMTGDVPGANDDFVVEHKPMFHEWASVQPGMICVSRKKKTEVFRQYMAAQTAMVVTACAACLPKQQEQDFFFAGIARTKSVRVPDDGQGPTTDEVFTVSLRGMATILNTSNSSICTGDLVEWCFFCRNPSEHRSAKRAKTAPRRIGVQTASPASSRLIGRALQFAKPGEPFDVLLSGT